MGVGEPGFLIAHGFGTARHVMLKRELSGDEIEHICLAERQADRCIETLRLSRLHPDESAWAVLAAAILQIERARAEFGQHSDPYRSAKVNLGRYCPMIIRWLGGTLPEQVDPNSPRWWNAVVERLANDDINTASRYDAFQCSYPMWHRDRVHASIGTDSVIRFTVDGTARDTQVNAYQQGHRPIHGVFQRKPERSLEPTESMLRRYQRILNDAVATDPYGFRYDHSYELARRTYNGYARLFEQELRRSEQISLGAYSLGEYKRFYTAIKALSAIHDYLCFRWMTAGHPYPCSSAVMVKARHEWIHLLSVLSGLSAEVTEIIVSDLTFYSKRLPDLHLFPFVPLDHSHSTLAMAPHFVLNSNLEENILRVCSYLRPEAYNLLSNDKERTMREDIICKLERFNVHHSVDLPDGSTEIDLIVEDEASSAVLIAELKWYRKPVTYRERLKTHAQFLDGVNRQLRMVKYFCRQNPAFLEQRRLVKRNLADYDHVYYMLIARDYWAWIEPADDTSVVDADQLLDSVSRHVSLYSALSDLLLYEWLPIEGRDFHVQYDRAQVEGVTIETEVFYGVPLPP